MVEGKFCCILIHVDDMIVASKFNELLIHCEKFLSSKCNINNLGEIRSYLNMEVKKDADGNFSINQTAYIKKIVNEFGLSEAKPSDIPMNTSYRKDIV